MEPRELLRANAKKLGDQERAFFYAEDRSADGEVVLHIDRKFADPKRFGNIKKIQALLKKAFSLEVSRKTKICAGVCYRDDGGTIVFRPRLQKANAGLMKKGARKFKKELVGGFRIELQETDSSEEVDVDALTRALAKVLGDWNTQSEGYSAASGPDKESLGQQLQALTDKALEAIGDYCVQRADNADDATTFLRIAVEGRTLGAWQDHLNDWTADNTDEDEDELDETFAAIQEEIQEAEREVALAKELVTASKKRLDEGNRRVVEVALDDSLLSLLQGKEPKDLSALLARNPRLASKLTEAVSTHLETVENLEASEIELQLKISEKEVMTATVQVEKSSRVRSETSSKLTDTVMDRSLLLIFQGKKPPTLDQMTEKLSPKVLDKVSSVVRQSEDDRDDLDRARSGGDVLTAKLSVREALKNLDDLEGGDSTAARTGKRAVSGGLLDQHDGELRVETAELRKRVRSGDDGAKLKLTAIQALTKRRHTLREKSISLDGYSLALDELVLALQTTDGSEQLTALAGVVSLRKQVSDLKAEIASLSA